MCLLHGPQPLINAALGVCSPAHQNLSGHVIISIKSSRLKRSPAKKPGDESEEEMKGGEEVNDRTQKRLLVSRSPGHRDPVTSQPRRDPKPTETRSPAHRDPVPSPPRPAHQPTETRTSGHLDQLSRPPRPAFQHRKTRSPTHRDPPQVTGPFYRQNTIQFVRGQAFGSHEKVENEASSRPTCHRALS
ncbi:unnamed protein product [Boreogadus saida]